jgi:AcrR family transcriptional regulator
MSPIPSLSRAKAGLASPLSASSVNRGRRRSGQAKLGPRPAEQLSKRDQLVETAWQLFYRDGYHATGIDRILADAGVAKMTLYKHFRSKDELILAALDRRSAQFRESVSRFLHSKKRVPERQLLAVFDWLITWVSSKEFRGCFLQKAMAEYQDLHDPIHQAALAHKTAFHMEIHQLVVEAGVANPKALAHQLALLVEGAIVSSHASGSAMPAVRHSRRAASRGSSANSATRCARGRASPP